MPLKFTSMKFCDKSQEHSYLLPNLLKGKHYSGKIQLNQILAGVDRYFFY